MRYIIVIILFLLSGKIYPQAPTVPGRNLPSNTPVDQRLIVERNIVIPRYEDTTAANLDLGADSTASLIYCYDDNQFYGRVLGPFAKKWQLVAASTTPPAGANREIQFNDAGIFGASTAFRWTSSNYLDISSGGMTILSGADNGLTTRTNNTAKTTIFAAPHYTNSEENVLVLKEQSFSGTNALQFGGGDAAYNAVNDLRFYAAANATTVTGTEKMRITSVGVYIGAGTNAAAKLHIEAGTTTAAPIRLTSGTNLTTAVAGSIEYNGSNFFFTLTGTSRRQLVASNIATPSNGFLPIGNGTDFTLAALTGTTNQVNVTNGSGTITLSLPQNVHTAATPQFAGMGIGTTGGSTNGVLVSGAFSSSGIWIASTGSTLAAFTVSLSSVSPAGGTVGAISSYVNNTIVEAGSGNHTLLVQSYMTIPTVTGAAATVDNTANLYIEGAMTATVSGRNYSLFVDNGPSRMDGSVTYGYRSLSANDNILPESDYYIEITANSPTLTLPTATGHTGLTFIFINSGAGTASVSTSGGQVIGNSGSATSINVTAGSSLTVVSTGSAWRLP